MKIPEPAEARAALSLAPSLVAEESLKKLPTSTGRYKAVDGQRHGHTGAEKALREVPRRDVPGQRHWEERVKRGKCRRVRPEPESRHQYDSQHTKQNVTK